MNTDGTAGRAQLVRTGRIGRLVPVDQAVPGGIDSGSYRSSYLLGSELFSATPGKREDCQSPQEPAESQLDSKPLKVGAKH